MERTENEVDRLATAVATLQTKLNKADRATAAALNVGSAEDIQVLRLLLSEGPLRVGELAHERASSMTTASGRISRLEKKGLVQRDRIPGDLRAMVVTLTKKGTKVAAQSREDRLRSLEPIAGGFPYRALDDLITAMTEGINGGHD